MDFLIDFLLSFYGPTPYLLVFGILLLCGLGVPIPEDITLFAGGLLVYYGVADLWLMIIVSMFGVLIGDSFVFWLGSHYGRRLAQKGIFSKLLPKERLDNVKIKFNQRGQKLLFAARFMPGFRAPIFFSAGTLHVPFRVFLLYDGVAALISVPAIIWAVYYFGDQIDRAVQVIKKVEGGIFAVILIALLAIFGKWYMNHRKLKRGLN